MTLLPRGPTTRLWTLLVSVIFSSWRLIRFHLNLRVSAGWRASFSYQVLLLYPVFIVPSSALFPLHNRGLILVSTLEISTGHRTNWRSNTP
ncbi:hypothetical protein F5Y13DRAFT_154880 [Hypoxylon sp. FL1857]|nr:hypothetical protein F5Y13DRAFT_154880 [Hypoxylon sp. FL1857]